MSRWLFAKSSLTRSTIALPNSQPWLVLVGPTAVGKTAVIEALADRGLPIEVVSADAFQVYRGLDIGTAKPEPALRAKLPHHLIDLLDPREPWSLGDFLAAVDPVGDTIRQRGALPILSGGTAYYVKHWLAGRPEAPPSDPAIRAALEARSAAEPLGILHADLAKIDPLSAARIHPNDRYRILRALEVYQTSGRALSSFARTARQTPPPQALVIGLSRDRTELRERIKQRVAAMFEQGLVAEVQGLRARGYTAADPGLRAIGYREFFESDDPVLIQERIYFHTCQYAKRQETFWRSIPGIEFWPAQDDHLVEKLIGRIKFVAG